MSPTHSGLKSFEFSRGLGVIAESASEGNAQLIGRYRVSIAGNRAIGAFLVDRDRFDCKPLAGVFIASPAAAPTPNKTFRRCFCTSLARLEPKSSRDEIILRRRLFGCLTHRLLQARLG